MNQRFESLRGNITDLNNTQDQALQFTDLDQPIILTAVRRPPSRHVVANWIKKRKFEKINSDKLPTKSVEPVPEEEPEGVPEKVRSISVSPLLDTGKYSSQSSGDIQSSESSFMEDVSFVFKTSRQSLSTPSIRNIKKQIPRLKLVSSIN